MLQRACDMTHMERDLEFSIDDRPWYHREPKSRRTRRWVTLQGTHDMIHMYVLTRKWKKIQAFWSLMANNSITNVSGDMGGMSGGAPCGPYAKNAAMLTFKPQPWMV